MSSVELRWWSPSNIYKQNIYIYIKEELLEASHNSPIDIALRLGHYNLQHS